MKFLITSLVLSIGLGASLASANCSDEVLADCGAFIFANTLCPIYSATGEVQGANQFYSAIYSDTSELPPMLGPSVELNRVAVPAGSKDEVHSASLTSETDVYVMISAKKGPQQNTEIVYSTYTTSRGRKSSIKECEPVPVR